MKRWQCYLKTENYSLKHLQKQLQHSLSFIKYSEVESGKIAVSLKEKGNFNG
jgi:hypothetical protein